MISPESRSIEWIRNVAKVNNAHHLTLVEKVIRAFSLLESLARSGCPFIFKGGSSLMLYFDTKKRMSIDIDIICPPGTNIENYLGMFAEESRRFSMSNILLYMLRKINFTLRIF